MCASHQDISQNFITITGAKGKTLTKVRKLRPDLQDDGDK